MWQNYWALGKVSNSGEYSSSKLNLQTWKDTKALFLFVFETYKIVSYQQSLTPVECFLVYFIGFDLKRRNNADSRTIVTITKFYFLRKSKYLIFLTRIS